MSEAGAYFDPRALDNAARNEVQHNTFLGDLTPETFAVAGSLVGLGIGLILPELLVGELRWWGVAVGLLFAAIGGFLGDRVSNFLINALK